nr:DUF4232 domain-containing protein [Pedococcus sp. 5OH_020]
MSQPHQPSAQASATPAASAHASASASGTSASSSSTARSGSVSSTAGTGRAGSCAVAPLRASTARVEGAAGSRYVTIRLTNEGRATCRMKGYPGVSMVASDRTTQLGAAAGRDTSVPPTTVTLRPHTSTAFILRVTQALNYPAATCRPEKAHGYRIYPPDSRTALLLADADLTGCASVTVHLMVVRPVGASAG